MLNKWLGSFRIPHMDDTYEFPSDHFEHPDLEPLHDRSAFRALWASLRFIYRDSCLEGETATLRRQIEGLSDYELQVLRASTTILVTMVLDERLARRVRYKG